MAHAWRLKVIQACFISIRIYTSLHIKHTVTMANISAWSHSPLSVFDLIRFTIYLAKIYLSNPRIQINNWNCIKIIWIFDLHICSGLDGYYSTNIIFIDISNAVPELNTKKYKRPKQSTLSTKWQINVRALVVAGAEGAVAPVNFEQRVHAPINFQPF